MSIFRKKIKDQICNAQNRSSCEMVNLLFDTYNNSVSPHGKHMFQTSYDMTMETMWAYPSSKSSFPYWKCVLRCCTQCPRIDLPSPELYQHN